MSTDEQQIRKLIQDWIDAAKKDDIKTILSLMTEDAVFLRPGAPPLKGRDNFAREFTPSAQHITLDGKSSIQEIVVQGNWAFCWNLLTVTVTPKKSGEPMIAHHGPVMTLFRKEADGMWRLWRDANMLLVQDPSSA